MGLQLKRLVDFARFLLRRFHADQGLNSAAALTYTTLFAVVPLMTVTFSMLSAVPAFRGLGEQIQSFIFHHFVPSTGETVQQYLQGFIQQARHLTWVGVLSLAVTALLMLGTVEKAFNAIWRVRQARRGVSSFLLYWAILSLGPLLLGSGFALSTYIASLALISGPNALPGLALLLELAPLLFSVAAFTLLYMAVPNTRVPLRHALTGGVLSALLFELAKEAFALFVSLFPGYQLIYGAFATVPLFLLWVYLCWLIVLLGAELVCNLDTLRRGEEARVAPLLALLAVLEALLNRQQEGQPLRFEQWPEALWQPSGEQWQNCLALLEAQQWICRAAGGGWLLSRDPSQASLNDLLSQRTWPLPRLEDLPKQWAAPWYPKLQQALALLEQEQQQLFSVSLRHFLSADQAKRNG